MSAWTAEEDLTDEQFMRKNLRSVPAQIISHVDEETADRRERRRQAERLEYERQNKINAAKLEAQSQLLARIEAEDTNSYLLSNGWNFIPRTPLEKYGTDTDYGAKT